MDDKSVIEDPEWTLLEDDALAKAMSDFRLSVNAWSDAAYHRPRAMVATAVRRTWTKALAWGMGCLLAVAVAGGTMIQQQHRRDLARIAAEREAQRQMAEKRAQEASEDLLARVDSDVSRDVPAAMDPLASLMPDEDSQ